MFETGARLSDLVKLGRHNLVQNGEDLQIVFTPQKTKNESGIQVFVTVGPELKKAIDLLDPDDPTFIMNQLGNSFSPKGYPARLKKWLRSAGVESPITSHGMRHTLGNDIAEDDGSSFHIMSTLGHSSPRTAERYTKSVNRRKLAEQAALKGKLRQKSLVGLATQRIKSKNY